MLAWIIVILLILWLLGYFGPNVFSKISRSGNAIHVLIAYRGHPRYFEAVGDRVNPRS